MRIAIVGSGYVGLVSGACLADFGHVVTCADLDAPKIAALKRGVVPIYEPGLKDLVAHTMATGRLVFSTDVTAAVADADVVFIAVGTPSRRGDGHADLVYVTNAAEMIGRAIRGFTVVVTKSTVPVGTSDDVARTLARVNPLADFAVVSNPEFLREGAAIEDFRRPDRIVVGVEDDRARQVMEEVYRPLQLHQEQLVFTGRRTAELIKYAANAFLAMKITFINEIADLCEKVGGDVQEVARGIGLDTRIGDKFLNAGPGYGGSCFPKDTLALLKTAQDHDVKLRLIEATVAANEARKRAMGRKVIAACGGSVRGKTVGVLGLTFKPDTDDMRDAPSLAILQTLLDHGARIRAYDPEGMAATRSLIDGIDYGSDAYAVAKDADCLVIVTAWTQFRALDLARIRAAMRTPLLVDLRIIYRPDEVARAGLSYTSVGRGAVLSQWDQLDAAE
jgi:UDPglucose 6-dehydrogenase